MQQKQSAWSWQWNRFHDANQWLFTEWIYPNTLENFRGKDVLDCGCGGGNQLGCIAPYCASALGIDLNLAEAAKTHTAQFPNVQVQEADIATMDLGRKFDIILSIGVLHHTDDPDVSFRNIAKHCKPGGRVIVWVYSREGNALNQFLLEPIKSILIHHLPRSFVRFLANIVTILVYIPVWTIYLLPLRFLPFYEYFQNWRRLSYARNLLNVFDKLNAPQTHFITREQITRWFSPDLFENIHISPYKGISWRGSGRRK